MAAPEVARLFHAVVVVGASIGAACRTDLPQPDGEGGSGPTSTSAASTTTQASSTTTGYVDCALADSPDDCLSPTDFHCGDGLYCEFMNFAECRCAAEAPDSPADCDFSSQFHCQQWEPVFTGCWCDTGAPGSAADCDKQCEFDCYSYQPLIGCTCFCPTGPQ